MDITVTRFDLNTPPADAPHYARRLLGSAVLDLGGMIVVHNVKLVRLDSRLIVSFPDEPARARCGWCGRKTLANERFCCGCGSQRPAPNPDVHIHRDVCHPVTAEARALVERLVIAAWKAAVVEREAEREVAGTGLATNGRASRP